MLYSIPFEEAQKNFVENPYSRWFALNDANPNHAVQRMRTGILYPGTTGRHRLSKEDSVFTIGSCFAREVEKALHAHGFNVLSLVTEDDKEARGRTDNVNRYNTYSILHELSEAAEGAPLRDDSFVRVANGNYVDLHSHPLFGPLPLESARAIRSWLTSYFRRALDASVVTVTLGLIEAWYDKQIERYINFAPIWGSSQNKVPLLDEPGRFEFHVLDFEQNMANLEKVYALLEKYNPDCKIIVTVSPVRLSATFTNRDITVANTLSKSMLRTCAETWQRMHPEKIDYFPSYEMADLSDRTEVWGPDGIHVYGKFVNEIMAHFKAKYIE
jgi:hypothetical protein